MLYGKQLKNASKYFAISKLFIDNVTHLAFEKLTWMDRRDMGLLFETSILWPF